MQNGFERELGLPKPQCCSLGACCKLASPSTPFYTLFEKAARGEEFARGFLSIMVPYASHEAARQAHPEHAGLIDRTIVAARKSEKFVSDEDVVFYKCRYHLENNLCGIHEDRPQFCRDYPESPYVVMAPGCVFEDWASACKDKIESIEKQAAALEQMKAELAALKAEAARRGLPE